MVKPAVGTRPLVPPMLTSEPLALLQQRPGGAREPHMGEELERIAVRPVGVGEGEEIAALGGAGIVDQDVEAAERALGGVGQCRRRRVLAQIDRHGLRLAAVRRDRCRRVLERRLVGAGQDEIAPFLGQRHGDAAPDAA